MPSAWTSRGPSSRPTSFPPTSPARSSTTSGRATFEFRKGPVFTGLLLADEINRTPPKTQAALLEAMQEHQVTVEGQTFPLATARSTSSRRPTRSSTKAPTRCRRPSSTGSSCGWRSGTPAPTTSGRSSSRRIARRREEQEARQVVDAAELLDLQATVEDVTVSPEVGRYCVALARATREHANVLMGSSPRGSLALLLVGRAYAVLRGRDYLTPDDVKAVAPAVLEHRVVIRPELWMSEVSSRTVVAELLRSVPTPRTAVRSS